MLTRTGFLWFLVVLQAVCGAYFLWEITASLSGWPSLPLRWQWREMVEIGAAIGLILGAMFGIWAALAARREMDRAAVAMRMAAGKFTDEVAVYFRRLDLSPAETEIAWLILKGLPPAEIARLRGTREGTIRAQNTAIYRKAGVNGKAQFIAQIVEDLLL